MTTLDLNLQSKGEWIEMFPFGVAIGASQSRPVMIFKDKSEKRVLPVWLSPIDAGIAVSQNGVVESSSPHELSAKILETLGVKLEKCLFREIRGHWQYVELHFSGSRKLKMMEAKAEDVISFCMRAGCKFFATIDYMEKSRVLESKHVMGNQMTMEKNPHPYLN